MTPRLECGPGMTNYDTSQFPAPQAPPLPVPTVRSFQLAASRPPIGILWLARQISLYSGRYAISAALEHAGIGKGAQVLVPAYHCLAMIEPMRMAGIEPIYYPILQETSVEPLEIEKRINPKVKAILAVHYFGILQDFSPLRQLADRFHLILIEDCSHACFGEINGRPVGSVGDYAVASTMKFFPIGHGGLLASARLDLTAISTGHPSFFAEIKTTFNLIESAIQFGRFRQVRWLIESMQNMRKRVRKRGPNPLLLDDERKNPPAKESPETDRVPEYGMAKDRVRQQSTRVSQFLLRHTRTADLTERRRHFYLTYQNAIATRTDCRPLFPNLPDGTEPQVFPLYVDHCLPVFVALKRQGVPIIRFGEFLDTPVTHAICPVSVDYSEHLLQFPCHQELTDEEVRWIIERLVETLDQVAMS